jgi:hypothetical protein
VEQVGAVETGVVVQLLVLPAGVNADVGGNPTAGADEASRWVEDDTPSNTLEEHY